MTEPARLTRIETRDPAEVGKTFSLDSEGGLKSGGARSISKGVAYLETVADLAGFIGLLTRLRRGGEVLTFGIPNRDLPEGGEIVTSEALAEPGGLIRSADHFGWPAGPGIMMLDFDPPPGEAGKPATELRGTLAKAAPGLGDVQSLWWPSSGSHIVGPDGSGLTGRRGMRAYVMVGDATDIPRAGKVLAARLWLAGFGRIEVSASGQMRERGPLDTSVWQPERLDFAAGAVFRGGLRQERGEPELLNRGGLPRLDTREALPDLTAAEASAYQEAVRAAKDAKRDEAAAKRADWARKRHIAEIRRAHPDLSEEDAAAQADADPERRAEINATAEPARRVSLPPETALHCSETETVTVAEILRDPKRWERKRVCDPIEPDYRNWDRCATVFAATGLIVSHAHGAGRTYVLGAPDDPPLPLAAQGRLLRAEIQTAEVFRRPEWTASEVIGAAPAAVALMAESAEEGGELVAALTGLAGKLRCKTEFNKAMAAAQSDSERVEAERGGRDVIYLGGPNDANEDMRRIGRAVRDKRLAFSYGGLPVVVRGADGAPESGARIVPLTAPLAHNVALDAVAVFGKRAPVSIPQAWGARMMELWTTLLPPLAGMADYPVWFRGGLLTGAGYHEASGLWLQTDGVMAVPFASTGEAVAFLRDEWLGDFPFQNPTDLATALMLPVAVLMAKTTLRDEPGPLFLVTAPNAGTGKTLLVNGLVAAVTGRHPPSTAYPAEEAERAKLLGALLREGAPVLFLDNLRSGAVLGRGDVTLTKLVTDAVFSGRVLGTSQTFAAPASIVPVATGNNVIADGDMARRTVQITLKAPPGENLARRTFRHPDFIRWTMENRGKILGALVALIEAAPAVGAAGLPGSFPAWARAVAWPVLSALGIDAEDFCQSWVEAAEDDGKGTHSPGMELLLPAIFRVRTDDAVQPIDGAWLTAGEILDGLRAMPGGEMLLADALPGGGAISEKRVSGLLRRNQATVDCGEAGAFRLDAERKHLGERTGRKPRWCFRVARVSPPRVPAAPGELDVELSVFRLPGPKPAAE